MAFKLALHSESKKTTDTKKTNKFGNHKNSDKDENVKISIPHDVLENKATEIGPFWSVDKPIEMSSRKILSELLPFYTKEKIEKLIVPRSIKKLGISKNYVLSDVMKEELNGISLRAVEWLVTNYSKGTKITLYSDVLKQRVDIHSAYEDQSSHYKRGLFDPFCRHDRIYFSWKLTNAKTKELEDLILVTTVGQLNFMKWAEENGVLSYAQRNRQNIQNAMEKRLSRVNKEKKECKKQGTKRKRRELTKAAEVFCVVYEVDTVLQLDELESPTSTSPKQSLKKTCSQDI